MNQAHKLQAIRRLSGDHIGCYAKLSASSKGSGRRAFKMARPREFDEAAVLDAAIDRFWRYGYEATSVRDLADEMNIAGASLYNAFGDKHGLYERALNRYLDSTFRERIRRLEPSLPPREAIAAFLQEIVKRSVTDKQRRGCMLVNSAIESAPHDQKFLEIVAIFLDEVESFFLRCVSKGQRDGTITKAYSAEDLSRSLLGILLGVRVLARVRPERKLLEGLVRPVLSLLDPAAAGRPKR
jgi:TetR/AcrR family transcriptional regulator, transcriptional repressor for nem operon